VARKLKPGLEVEEPIISPLLTMMLAKGTVIELKGPVRAFRGPVVEVSWESPALYLRVQTEDGISQCHLQRPDLWTLEKQEDGTFHLLPPPTGAQKRK
jgi:hypothetical protein